MIVYRLASDKYIKDLNGTGGLYGPGRWHETGTKVLYTAETFSLAKLETLANSTFMPKNMAVVRVEIPDDVSIKELMEKDLPGNWADTPAPMELKEIALEWIRENRDLVMKVPSVHSPFERNYLINPLHPDHGRLKIVDTRPHPFDPRLKPEEVTEPKPKKKVSKLDKGDIVTIQDALKDPKNVAGGGKMRIIRKPKGK
ncbi:RES family NAD+ phosphorylase [Pontibacter pamirensis]|uniref:RES family NAD+ phosphorylase n=1 Tax=Pontibacter pamirensis TaxID=2562824 RepID=UPI0013896794|nr:RES family NAD+ phosphorylase [Pontibacter pamirensis]